MKHSLAALLLAVTLLGALLTSCGQLPSEDPDHTNGTPSDGNSSTTEPDAGDDNSINAPKLSPTVSMQYNINYNGQKGADVVSCVFTIRNNSAYSLSSLKLNLTMTDANGKTESTYTMAPTIAPNDEVRFVYLYTCKNIHPNHVGVQPSTTPSGYKVPEKDAGGNVKMVRTSDLYAPRPTETKNYKVDYNSFKGIVTNHSKYAASVKVSLILKKDGQIVSGDAATLFLTIPAGGSQEYSILHYRDVPYDDYEVTATPW